MNFELAYLYVMEYLPANLPEYIHYHNVEHTVEVVRNIETIARGENVNDEEMVILKTRIVSRYRFYPNIQQS
ncbi:MAG: hypothetical protein IPP29_06825 [Bacteroidetes bacterium]|nr:hypothetical protein [Bacteroidota bacterium]